MSGAALGARVALSERVDELSHASDAESASPTILQLRAHETDEGSQTR